VSDHAATSSAGVKGVAASRPLLYGLLIAATAVAFADSSIVVLAIPEIVPDFDTGVQSASWVVTAYNLAVVVAGIALFWLARSFSPANLAGIGLIVFGGASAVCAAAPDLGVLVGMRALQGIGAAALLVAALPLLEQSGRGAAPWLLAATIGTAAGPALGGLLTEFFSWRSIFVVQAPMLVVGVFVLMNVASTAPAETADRVMPDRKTGWALASLAALSAALVGALFLVIVLLIAGLRWDPLPASLMVTTLPVLAFVADRFSKRLGEVTAALSGCLLVKGGLVALAFLPGPDTPMVIAGLALCGIGLGLASRPLGHHAVGINPSTMAGTRTVVARHAGLVVGLLVVTPLLVSSFGGLREDAEQVIGKTVLEAPIPLQTKLPLILDITKGARSSHVAPPDVDAIFAGHGADSNPAVAELKDDFTTQMDELVTRTFRHALLATGMFALLAAILAPGIGRPREELKRRKSIAVVAGAAIVGAAFLGVDIARGALDDPVAAVDPCNSELQLQGGGIDFAVQRAALKGLDAIACRTGTSRVELMKKAIGGASGGGGQTPQLPQLPPLQGLLPPGGGPPGPP
jgi:MFS family permease